MAQDAGRAARVVLVTGAASGLGEAIVGRLAATGDRVVVADLDERRTEQVADNLTAAGGDAEPMTVDVTTEGEVAAMIDAVLERHGHIDAIVFTSTVEARTALVECPEEEWDGAIAASLKGPFLCLKHGIPALAKGGGGSTVIVAPETGGAGRPGPPAHAVVGGARARLPPRAACAHVADHVRVNVVVPDDGPDAWEDVCDAVAFLVAPTPQSLTGSVFTLRSTPGAL